MALQIKAKFGPRVTTLSGSPDEIERLLLAARRGFEYEGNGYPNATDKREFYLARADECQSLADYLSQELLDYHQGKGL